MCAHAGAHACAHTLTICMPKNLSRIVMGFYDTPTKPLSLPKTVFRVAVSGPLKSFILTSRSKTIILRSFCRVIIEKPIDMLEFFCGDDVHMIDNLPNDIEHVAVDLRTNKHFNNLPNGINEISLDRRPRTPDQIPAHIKIDMNYGVMCNKWFVEPNKFVHENNLD